MKLRVVLASLILAVAVALAGSPDQLLVVNGASFHPGQPIAPGSFATIFGEGLSSQTVTAEWTGPGKLPTELGGASVTIDGTPAMLYFVSPGQINFIVPENLGPGMASITVNTGSKVLTGSMVVGPGPGVFALNGMGVGQGAVLHGNLWKKGPFSVTTSGQPTPVAIYVTGLDLASKPVVTIGGVPVEVTWYGAAPGYTGLQQINVLLPPDVAGSGRVPVTVTSGGTTSNVIFMSVLPTPGMIEGIPGWGRGKKVAENARRGREVSHLAFNAVNNTALISDEDDDVVRVISLDSKTIVATITLPSGSEALGVAVNAAGTLAAAALSEKGSVALIDLAQKQVIATIATGDYPSHVVFVGSNLLVTNAASGTVSVVDTNTRTVARTVTVGLGPWGIAVAGNLAVVANMHGDSLSLINLSDYTVSGITLPAGSRPHEVAIAPATNKAVITMPQSNAFLLVNLASKEVTLVETGAWNARGPGAVAAHGNLAFIANQTAASITVADTAAAKVVTTFPVDPGPRALAVNAAKNQLLVLAQGAGTLDVVDLASYAIVARIDADDSDPEDRWSLAQITSVTPLTAAVGSSFVLTITGANLQGVKDVSFHLTGVRGAPPDNPGRGRGAVMGHGGGQGLGGEDPNIKVSNVQASTDGTRVTASVQILASATPGLRQIRLETDRGLIMGPLAHTLFTVTR